MPFRNVESHFSRIPNIKIERSKMNVNKDVKTTFDAAELVPFYVREILPGDTFKLDYDAVVRMSTSIHPTMDNLYIDTYFFYVPNRLCWKNFTKFMGETDKAWVDTDANSLEIPHISIDDTTNTYSVENISLIHHLGLPPVSSKTYKIGSKFNLLPLSAYIKIWNDYFRDANYVDACPNPIYNDDLGGAHNLNDLDTYLNAVDQWQEDTFGDSGGSLGANPCFRAARYHDYFSSVLPQPQRGDDVLINPLIPAEVSVNLKDDDTPSSPVLILDEQGTPFANVTGFTTSPEGTFEGNLSGGGNNEVAIDPQGSLVVKDLNITVNALRLAFQTQKLLELSARGGSRYIEQLKSMFNVTSSDARLQRAEYLGGDRHLVNVSEVIQTSSTTETSALGSLSGRLVSHIGANCVRKSFEEHGWLLGLCVVRSDRTYAQGIQRQFQRTKKLDYYYPVLAHIGEQPVYSNEIYAYQSSNHEENEVFGYQEAWADYRYDVNELKGAFNPGDNSSGSLLAWTFGDYYTEEPFMSSGWLYSNAAEIDRTLAVQSKLASQFIADFYIHGDMVRPMPVFSVPGLIDHY